jgi:DedD protein
MPLPSFLQRLRKGASGQAPLADAMPLSQSDIEATRTRARRRLIGMVVLVGAGVVGFPWLFETQPRPLSSDVQIVQSGAAGEGAVTPTGHPRPMASGKVAVSGIVAPPAAEPEPAADTRPEPRAVDTPARDAHAVATREPLEETIVDAPPAAKPSSHPPSAAAHESHAPVKATEPKVASKPVPAKPAEKDKPVAKPQDKVASKPVVKVADKPADKTVPKPADKPAEKMADKAADKDATRYIVQIGAFGESAKAQEVRLKVERLGIKTYTQAVDTPDGKRIRVRVGPFADKAEADKAMATLRKAGLAGNLLTL